MDPGMCACYVHREKKRKWVEKEVQGELKCSEMCKCGSSCHLVRREGVDVLQKRRPHLRAALEHARELSGRQL